MATIDPQLIKQLQRTDIPSLMRKDLGVHLDFSSINETLLKIKTFLLEISQNDSFELSNQEVQIFENRTRSFLQITTNIARFSPTNQDFSARNGIINEVENEWEQTRNILRGLHLSTKLSAIDFETYEASSRKIFNELEANKARMSELMTTLAELPVNTERNFNQFFSDTQKRIDNEISRNLKELKGLSEQYGNDFRVIREQSQQNQASFLEEIKLLQNKVEEKIAEVQQQARKFSAKEALTTYAQIYNDEAVNINLPAIKKWEFVLVGLIACEIFIAIGMHIFFSLDIVFATTPELISIIFIKVFILSAIAVLIAYSVKNLNAQNHLYATNKFKANSLSSFQAFIEASTDDAIINQIIQHVSIAVYTQNISGYLSKDDSSNVTTKDVIETISSKISPR